jgi:demethylmenaquinone methyltransferase/2-methoxy-6-polyprenyl-1,4-benzoquinol methylase/phosphoethanolamine N-methyltransferase
MAHDARPGAGISGEVIDLARMGSGDIVLDVGGGTGTLAIAAARRVGASGRVYGIDASQEMLDVATRKARKAAVEVTFQTAIVESLPFPDAYFDVVLSTLMLHHLPQKPRLQGVQEIRRVLKSGGRFLAVDFGEPARKKKGLLGRLHHRHGYVPLTEIIAVLDKAGLKIVESGAIGIRDLNFVIATVQ